MLDFVIFLRYLRNYIRIQKFTLIELIYLVVLLYFQLIFIPHKSVFLNFTTFTISNNFKLFKKLNPLISFNFLIDYFIAFLIRFKNMLFFWLLF